MYRRAMKATMMMSVGLLTLIGAWIPAKAEPLAVGAPPSLRSALSEILPMFEREYGASVRVVYGPSKTLSRQIEHGAPIDVFLAAGVAEVAALYQKGLTLNGAPRIYAQTSLVLVMSSDSSATLVSFHDGLPDRRTRIALGDPASSSLGVVTHRALSTVTPPYKGRYQILHAPHSEDVVNLIHTGKADVGLVFRIDAINSGSILISDETPAGMHVPVQFSQAVVSTCRDDNRELAAHFSDFLMSTRIQKLLLQYGFDSVSVSG